MLSRSVTPVSSCSWRLSTHRLCSATSSSREVIFGGRPGRATCHLHDRRVRVRSVQGSGLSPEFKEAVDNLVNSNKVVVFMKGTKQFPQCGFSNTVVQILRTMEVPFETVNILENDSLRSGMKEYSQWPTFPQVYIEGEFFGGCDIMIDAYQSGELKEVLEKAMMS